jgi:hypothetical protein
MTRKFSSGNLAVPFALFAVALCALGDEPKNLLKPTNKTDSWRFEQHDAAKGSIAAADDAILLTTTETDGTDWHVQAYQTGLDLKDGKEYVVTFKAKASGDRAVGFNAMIDQEDWHDVGLSENIDLGKDWKDYKYEFKADQTVANKNRIGFKLGVDKGQVWVKDLVLSEKH